MVVAGAKETAKAQIPFLMQNYVKSLVFAKLVVFLSYSLTYYVGGNNTISTAISRAPLRKCSNISYNSPYLSVSCSNSGRSYYLHLASLIYGIINSCTQSKPFLTLRANFERSLFLQVASTVLA